MMPVFRGLPLLLVLPTLSRWLLGSICSAQRCSRPALFTAVGVTLTTTFVLAAFLPGFGVDVLRQFDRITAHDTYVRVIAQWAPKHGRIGVSLLTFGNEEHPPEIRPAPLDRNKIADALLAARQGGARVIVLDVDLGMIESAAPDTADDSSASCGTIAPAKAEAPPPGTQRLAALLRCWGHDPTLAAEAEGQDPDQVPAAQQPEVDTRPWPVLVLPTPTPRPEEQADRWLDTVASVRLVSARFQADPDGVVRNWTLSDGGTDGAARCGIVLMAAWSYLRSHVHRSLEGSTDTNRDDSERALRDFQSRALAHGAIERGSERPICRAGKDRIISTPIGFSAPASWLLDPEDQELSPAVREAIRHHPVHPLELGEVFFKDRVVVIGGVHEEITDNVATPFGLMPGVVVIANAINSSVETLPQSATALNVKMAAAAIAMAIIITILLAALSAIPASIFSFIALAIGAGGINNLFGPAFIYGFLVQTGLVLTIWFLSLGLGSLAQRWDGTATGLVTACVRTRDASSMPDNGQNGPTRRTIS
jgi:hypothetical protein